MSLRLKLLTSFGLILLIWLSSGYYIVSHLNQLDQLQTSLPEIDLKKNLSIRLFHERLQSLRTALILQTNVKSAAESERNIQSIFSIQRTTSEQLDSLQSLSLQSRALSGSFHLNWFDQLLMDAARNADWVDTLYASPPIPQTELERLHRVIQYHDSLSQIKDQYLRLLKRRKTVLAAEILTARINPLFDTIYQSAETYGALSTLQTRYKLNIIHRMTIQIKLLIYLFWSLTLLFMLIFIYYYFQKIIHAIHRLKEASYRIARGEFETRIENKSFAEMDDLADSFNTMGEQLQELEKLKSDFFNKLVHDFKSPLDNIKQSADVLLNEIAGGALNAKQKEFLEIIKQSSMNLRVFVQDQLDESKLISGQMSIQYEPTDVKTLVTERIQLQKPIATARRIHFNLKYTPTPLMIECDRAKISRVIDNLLNNAIKFSYEQTSVDVELDETGALFECRIKDHGPGIPYNQRERIFQKYVRLQTQFKTPGTGLGLYTAKYIIELHQGTIWVESKTGVGSTFALSLPKSMPAGKK